MLAWAPLVGSGDTLVVPDGRLQRVNLYAPDGSYCGSYRWRVGQGRTMAFRSTTSGEIAEQLRPVWDPMEDQETTRSTRDVIVIRSLRGVGSRPDAAKNAMFAPPRQAWPAAFKRVTCQRT